MGIPNENLAMVILLDELTLQCELVNAAVGRLIKAKQAWVTGQQQDGASPLDIVGHCIVCLSSAAAISRLLKVGRRTPSDARFAKRRCKMLTAILGSPALGEIGRLKTRNSWEHMDERLDDVLSKRRFTSFSEVHVAITPPSTDTFVHHYFDPVKLEIRHMDDKLRLSPLQSECTDLIARVHTAKARLTTEVHFPYAAQDV
jgi:hypothetical protein